MSCWCWITRLLPTIINSCRNVVSSLPNIVPTCLQHKTNLERWWTGLWGILWPPNGAHSHLWKWTFPVNCRRRCNIYAGCMERGFLIAFFTSGPGRNNLNLQTYAPVTRTLYSSPIQTTDRCSTQKLMCMQTWQPVTRAPTCLVMPWRQHQYQYQDSSITDGSVLPRKFRQVSLYHPMMSSKFISDYGRKTIVDRVFPQRQQHQIVTVWIQKVRTVSTNGRTPEDVRNAGYNRRSKQTSVCHWYRGRVKSHCVWCHEPLKHPIVFVWLRLQLLRSIQYDEEDSQLQDDSRNWFILTCCRGDLDSMLSSRFACNWELHGVCLQCMVCVERAGASTYRTMLTGICFSITVLFWVSFPPISLKEHGIVETTPQLRTEVIRFYRLPMFRDVRRIYRFRPIQVYVHGRVRTCRFVINFAISLLFYCLMLNFANGVMRVSMINHKLYLTYSAMVVNICAEWMERQFFHDDARIWMLIDFEYLDDLYLCYAGRSYRYMRSWVCLYVTEILGCPKRFCGSAWLTYGRSSLSVNYYGVLTPVISWHGCDKPRCSLQVTLHLQWHASIMIVRRACCDGTHSNLCVYLKYLTYIFPITRLHRTYKYIVQNIKPLLPVLCPTATHFQNW